MPHYEYFSKFHLIWKPVLSSDCIASLKKYGYEIREVKKENRIKIITENEKE